MVALSPLYPLPQWAQGLAQRVCSCLLSDLLMEKTKKDTGTLLPVQITWTVGRF